MKMFSWIWNKFGFILLIFFIVVGFFHKSVVLYAIICMLGPIVLASLGYGRLWCKKMCPRGNLYDNVVCKFCEKNTTPKFLTSTAFRIAVILFVFFMFGMGISKYWGDFEQIGGVFHRMIIATTLAGIILSFFFNHRTWCCLCPMGSIACFITKIKKKNDIYSKKC